MVRFLLLLTWLLLSLTKANNVQAACYAGTWANGAPVYGSLFVDGTTTLAQCQALACEYYPSISPTCPQPCQQETQSQVLNCPSGYNGTITQTKTKTCPANVWGDWITSSNTCVSTCVPVTQTQTLSCPANHTGQITQTNTKTCPDNQWQGWVTSSNTCVANPVTCTYSAQTENRSCPVNFSGSQTWKKETNCPSGSYGQPVQTDWFKIQDSCTPNPPTCQISSQLQTLSCPTGYTGSITQTRSSMCPDPYGGPTWLPWATTSDTCKKSASNPTNPVSPVNPASPTNQNSTISAPTIQSSPVTVPTPTPVPNLETTQTTTETNTAPKVEGSATSQSAQTSASETKTDSQTTSTTQVSPTPKGKQRSVVGLVLSLELFVKPGLQQPNVFPEVSIVGGIPNNILMQDSIMMNLLQQPSFNQPAYNQDLGFEQ